MPGIVGIIGKQPFEENREQLKIMLDTMKHESFYNTGTYTNEKLGLYVGWVTIKGSFSDCMPISNAAKDVILIFSGENFTDETLENKFIGKHSKIKKPNATYLIHLYEKNPQDFLKHLNGFFNGVLVDLKNEKVMLFNDRYGMQRIYYHESKPTFIFSSEAKSILKIRPGLRKIDYVGLGQYFSCGCVLENRTLFSNISLLPGGSAWVFNNGYKLKKKSYFIPNNWEDQKVLGPAEFYEKLKALFPKILTKYLDTSRKMALSLTGGLDTRLILACHNFQSASIPCYTHAGIYRESYDVKVARKVANACRLSHRVLMVGKEYLTDFPNLAEKTIYISDGSLDVVQSVGLYTNKLARYFADIRLTGNYGSEVLRNSVMFKPTLPYEPAFDTEFYKNVRQTKNIYNNVKSGYPLTFIAFKQLPWHLYNRYVVESSQLVQRSPYMDNDLLELLYQAPPSVLNSNAISIKILEDFNPSLKDILTDRGVGGNYNDFITLIIKAYLEFTFKMDYYFNHGMPQLLARFNYIFSFLELEKLFLGRHKYNHFRVWFRDYLSGYLKEILLDKRARSRSYINGKKLEYIVRQHTDGRLNFTHEITILLSMELLHRILIDDF